MSRTISWLPRLKQIRAAVEKSPLSLWERSDLENLFELQSRAANNLLARLPRGRGPARALLVERDALLTFLGEVERTGRVPASRTKVSKKRLRLTVRPARDVGKGNMEAIPNTVQLEPGLLAIEFKDGENLIEQLWAVALAARDDTDAFLQRCFPDRPAGKLQPSERDVIEATLRELESAFAKKKAAGVVSIAAAGKKPA